jgi:hypothetical protein
MQLPWRFSPRMHAEQCPNPTPRKLRMAAPLCWRRVLGANVWTHERPPIRWQLSFHEPDLRTARAPENQLQAALKIRDGVFVYHRSVAVVAYWRFHVRHNARDDYGFLCEPGSDQKRCVCEETPRAS